MTPQEIAERVLSYGTPKEPTIIYTKLHEAADAMQWRACQIESERQRDVSLHNVPRPAPRPGWMA